MSLERRGWLKCNSWIIKSSRDRSIHAAKHFPNHEIIQTRFPLQFNKYSLSLSLYDSSLISIEFRIHRLHVPSTCHHVCFLPGCTVYLRICPLCIEDPVYTYACIHFSLSFSPCIALSYSISLCANICVCK